MKQIYLIITIACLITISCEENEDVLNEATPEFLIAGSDFKKWQLVDLSKLVPGALPNDYKSTPSCLNGELPNGAGVFYQIYLDGTIKFEDGCGTKGFIDGTWSFSADKQSLIIAWPSSNVTWPIDELTVSKLSVNVNNTKLNFIPTPL